MQIIPHLRQPRDWFSNWRQLITEIIPDSLQYMTLFTRLNLNWIKKCWSVIWKYHQQISDVQLMKTQSWKYTSKSQEIDIKTSYVCKTVTSSKSECRPIVVDPNLVASPHRHQRVKRIEGIEYTSVSAYGNGTGQSAAGWGFVSPDSKQFIHTILITNIKSRRAFVQVQFRWTVSLRKTWAHLWDNADTITNRMQILSSSDKSGPNRSLTVRWLHQCGCTHKVRNLHFPFNKNYSLKLKVFFNFYHQLVAFLSQLLVNTADFHTLQHRKIKIWAHWTIIKIMLRYTCKPTATNSQFSHSENFKKNWQTSLTTNAHNKTLRTSISSFSKAYNIQDCRTLIMNHEG